MKQMFRQWHNALSLVNKKLILDKKAEDANLLKLL